MTEHIDLGVELANYTGGQLPSKNSARNSDDAQLLGDFLQNQPIAGITGPPGPPPAWVITDPPLRGVAQMKLADLGAPPPTLCFDADGVYFTHPETGERVNVEMSCQGCGDPHPGSLTNSAADHRWLCDKCRDG